MHMECENCGHEALGRDCPDCRETVPAWAVYCPLCGVRLPEKPAAALDGDPFSLENRRLCPDDNCIGILGPDGKCVICGKS